MVSRSSLPTFKVDQLTSPQLVTKVSIKMCMEIIWEIVQMKIMISRQSDSVVMQQAYWVVKYVQRVFNTTLFNAGS